MCTLFIGKKLLIPIEKNVEVTGKKMATVTESVNTYRKNGRVHGPLGGMEVLLIWASQLMVRLNQSIYIYKSDCLYLCPLFTPEPPDQSPPNFAQTSPPTQGRFLTQA